MSKITFDYSEISPLEKYTSLKGEELCDFSSNEYFNNECEEDPPNGVCASNTQEMVMSDNNTMISMDNSFASTLEADSSRYSSAFTPLRKRDREVSISPVMSIRKTLRFDSSLESTPVVSRNMSSIVDELVDGLDVKATADLVVINNCPVIRDSYEKEFITVKQIGEGNFTLVDFVVSKSTNTAYAIKRSKQCLTKPSERRQFVREIRMFREVENCPNMMQYYKSWQEDSQLYTLMECCSRGSLRQYMGSSEMIPESFLWYLVECVCDTLLFLHSHSIVHLDIKPDNLLFTDIGALRVGDLGSSAHADEVCSLSDRRYMGLGGLEDRTTPMRDIFSLGLVVYECMSKEELPLSGYRWLELRQGGITDVIGYSGELNSVVQYMIHPDTHTTVSELIQRLPGSKCCSVSDNRALIRSMLPLMAEPDKTPRRRPCVITSSVVDDMNDRSEMSTPVEVVHSAYSMKFQF